LSSKGFKPGEKVPKTGIYYCKTDEDKLFKLNITDGVDFPSCEKCEKKEVLWFSEDKSKK